MTIESNDAVNVDEGVGDDAESALTSGFAAGRMASKIFDVEALIVVVGGMVFWLRGDVTTGGAFKGTLSMELLVDGVVDTLLTAKLLDVVVDVVEGSMLAVLLEGGGSRVSTLEDGAEIIAGEFSSA